MTTNADSAPRLERPVANTAVLHLLAEGYVRPQPDGSRRVGASVSYVRDGDVHVIVDPGFQASRDHLLSPLAALGVAPAQITDVVFSHHHPDHTVNVALFPNARIHDHWATYEDGDHWLRRPAEGFAIAPSILLIETPGHTPQDITTLVGTAEGVVALTHLWGNATQAEDPLATDPASLHANRARVLRVAARIVPGHGAPFTVDASTPG